MNLTMLKGKRNKGKVIKLEFGSSFQTLVIIISVKWDNLHETWNLGESLLFCFSKLFVFAS